MTRWGVGAVLLVAIVLAPGCGGAGEAATPSKTSVQEFPSATTVTAPPPSDAAGAGGNPAPNQSTSKAVNQPSPQLSSRNGASAPAAPSGPAASPTQMTVKVTPTCVRRGQILNVEIWTVSRAALALIIGYSDGQPHGAMHIDDAREDGTYTWRVLVAPDVPLGKGKVLISSSNGNESDARDVLFEVASGTKCT
jgi:hypothetical protein